MQQGPEPQRLAAGEVLRERFRQHLCHRISVAREETFRVPGQRHRFRHDRQGVVMDVKVVKAALIDPVQRTQLRQDLRGGAGALQHRQPRHRGIGAENLLELGQYPLGRDRGQPRSSVAGGSDRRPLRLEAELGGKPRQTHDPQRVGGERARAHHPQPARSQVGLPPERVDQLAAVHRLRHRVDRQVPGGQVGFDRVAGQGQEVQLPGAIPSHHSPAAEALGELEPVRPEPPPELARQHARISVHRRIQVGGVPAQQPVPDRTAHQPRPAGGQLRQLGQHRGHRGWPSR
jgi:hypothetical protein